MSATDPALRYDRRTIALHWATAALVLLAWGMAQIIDYFPRGPLRVDARSVHITLGLAVGLVLAMRIIHRSSYGTALPAADTGWLQVVAKATHYGLYLLVLGQVLTGISFALVRGDSIFNLFTLNRSDDRALRESVGSVHALGAYLILALAGLHAAAALWHHYVRRDGVLARMMPGSGRA